MDRAPNTPAIAILMAFSVLLATAGAAQQEVSDAEKAGMACGQVIGVVLMIWLGIWVLKKIFGLFRG